MTGVVLLTGATGFVGHQVLKALLEHGEKIRVVVREGRSSEQLESFKLESVWLTPDLFRESADWWAEVCAGVDTVIHLAWFTEPGKYLESSKNIICLQGTLELAEGAIRAGVRRFIGVGTCFEYDLSVGRLTTDTELRPLTTYGGAKAAAYLALLNRLKKVGMEFAWCRLFYLYGEGEDPRRLIPYLRTRLAAGEIANLSKGNQIRDFLDVAIAGRMIMDVAMGQTSGAVNICSGRPVTVRELAESIADEYGRRDLLNFGAQRDNPADPICVLGVR